MIGKLDGIPSTHFLVVVSCPLFKVVCKSRHVVVIDWFELKLISWKLYVEGTGICCDAVGEAMCNPWVS